MRKNHISSTLMLLIAAPTLLVSCQKVRDYVEANPDAEIKTCGISRFAYKQTADGFSDTLTFTYNQAGDPVTATRPHPGTGTPNYLFKYKNGRLWEFIGVYSDGIATENWHRYFYDQAGRVKTDSVYNFARLVNGNLVNPYSSYAITFVYDTRDRIIQETFNYPGGFTVTQSYQYNTDGNIAGASYGADVSFRRSNKIWMFLDRDYSVNDRKTSSNFNSSHLPGTVNLDAGSSDHFLGNYFNQSVINYLCDGKY